MFFQDENGCDSPHENGFSMFWSPARDFAKANVVPLGDP
jgi:hypothetical protein